MKKKVKDALEKVAIVIGCTFMALVLLAAIEFFCVAMSKGTSGGPILELIGLIYPDFKKPQPLQCGDCPHHSSPPHSGVTPCHGGCLAGLEICVGNDEKDCKCKTMANGMCMEYEDCMCVPKTEVRKSKACDQIRLYMPYGGAVHIETKVEKGISFEVLPGQYIDISIDATDVYGKIEVQSAYVGEFDLPSFPPDYGQMKLFHYYLSCAPHR